MAGESVKCSVGGSVCRVFCRIVHKPLRFDLFLESCLDYSKQLSTTATKLRA